MEETSALSRLYDLHTFFFEEQFYGRFTYISEENARVRFKKIWKWIKTALSVEDDYVDSIGRNKTEFHLGIEECFVVLFGNNEYPTTVAKTIYTLTNPLVDTETLSIGTDLPQELQKLLENTSTSKIKWETESSHKVVSFYILSQKEGSEEKPTKLSDFLDIQTYLVSKEGKLICSENRVEKPIETVKDILTEPRGIVFYQKVCFIFGCNNEKTARDIAQLADAIISGLITTWGGDIEKALGRAKAFEEAAQAWSHEIGNFLTYLDSKNKPGEASVRLYNLTLSFLELATRASVKSDKLPATIDSWQGMEISVMMERAIEQGSKFAVLRNFRSNDNEIRTNQGLNNKIKLFKARFGEINFEDKNLTVASVDENSIWRLASFAQFLIFSLYSAARFSKEENSISITLSKGLLRVENPYYEKESIKSEAKAIIIQAFSTLWQNSGVRLFYGPIGKRWIIEGSIPEDIWEKSI